MMKRRRRTTTVSPDYHGPVFGEEGHLDLIEQASPYLLARLFRFPDVYILHFRTLTKYRSIPVISSSPGGSTPSKVALR